MTGPSPASEDVTAVAPPRPDLEAAFRFFCVDADDVGAAQWLKASTPQEINDAWSLDRIAEILDFGLLRYPYAVLIERGVPVDPARFTESRRVAAVSVDQFINATRTAELIANGATLVLNAVEQWEPTIGRLAGRLQAEAGVQVQVTAFVTPPASVGMALHRDDVDVFAVQLDGRKRWTLGDVPSDGSWRAGTCEDGYEANEVLTVNQGETLFMPRGLAHRAEAQTELSLHVSFTLRRPRQRMVLEGVVKQLLGPIGNELVLPADREAAAAVLAGELSALARAVERVDTKRLVDAAYRDALRSSHPLDLFQTTR